jgi:PKD domain
MKKVGWILLGMTAVAGASAQSLYAPTRTIDEQGIKLSGWGSGTISQTDELKFEGSYSLRVSTRNYFQGGMMMLTNPVDLASAYADKNNLLRFSYRVAGSGLTLNTGGGGAAGGGGGASGADAGGGGGTVGGTTGNTGPLSSDAQLQNVRVIVTTADGLRSEAFVKVSQTNSWRAVAIPLAAINGFERTNKKITGLAFSGDATSTFYVGDIKVINDSTPITGEFTPRQDMNLALGDEVTFTAQGFGGSSVLKYTWDFDDKDGDDQVDAEGQVIKRRFRKPGTYTVTLTIRDAYGAKAPVKSTVKVKVNP